MNEIQIGNRVVATADVGAVKKGMVGTVIGVPADIRDNLISVEWDSRINGHNCGAERKISAAGMFLIILLKK